MSDVYTPPPFMIKVGAVLTVACLIEIARIILTVAWGALSTGI
ncbi:MAG: hypothetical protein QNJ55_32485 [Xenococcus sp. MO_188.B8]|nr:hypothetical protein [Xenococcus sp. MO_188.B8]